ncbi:undecaprenyl pyrophosphate synthetase family protein [Arabidopsis lyrata subsp. lyrata]|uniref:Alkyl transferase n=1 Tax=Arabidopsis lyrata subsp. lyrata TaxID=81972 RepID=D7MTV0_ARALL|nr:undecaprenyl pyrophosphate synthetase family protein [Arabidopsis lyrata subsp. lyrata]
MNNTREEVGEFTQIFNALMSLMRTFIFKVLRVGPIPTNISFIMDGNRRFAKKRNLEGLDAGHRAGFISVKYILQYCKEIGVPYVTLYAFGMDNFKRGPEEVKCVMDLMLEKVELTIDQAVSGNMNGVRIIFAGDLNSLNERFRAATQKLMKLTEENRDLIVVVCVAYSTSVEIVHAVRDSCVRKSKIGDGSVALELSDIEECMYTSVVPVPDLVIRTGGGDRLSNFMTWQTSKSLLHRTEALWPELGLWHLVWAILKFQRMQDYLQKKKKFH